MSIAIQFRRGTTVQHSSFAGLSGELTVDTTKKTLVVHDNSTLGGFPLSKEGHAHVVADVSGLKYQQIQIAGTNQTAQPTLNLSNLFAASNDVPNSRTTVDLATNNTSGAGTYGTATRSPRLTLNAQGLVTAVSEVTISGVAPAGTATGDLTGSYPNPTVATVGGQTATNVANGVTAANGALSTATASTIVKRDSSGNFAANVITADLVGSVTGNVSGTAAAITGNLTGDVTSSGMTTALSASGVVSGTYGDGTHVPRVSIDTKGRITSVTSTTISGAAPTGGAGGDLAGSYPSPTIATVGGSLAADVHSGVVLANNSTASAVASQIAKRDGNGSSAFTSVLITPHLTSYTATPTFDLTLGGIQQITLAGDVTSSSISGAATGQIVIFDIIQDSSGNHSFVWPTNVFGGGTVGVSGNKHNCQMFYSDGSNFYAVSGIRTDLG